ncbi:hypothetical protein 8F11_91 [uncultured Caudovirales phage]|uniref:Uncharacterized protein n=1 Tax=uncultured Caudovirales phage TaxID=2100421 RepID=A0A2H4J6M1_9CAUD|nr:hypothetical protein 8F11_91 [uncultured Caudovirales phage]
MKIEASIPVWTDDCNSYPPDLKVEVHENFITLKLEGPEREITIKKTEFDALVRYINL